MNQIYRSNGIQIKEEFMEPIEEESKNKSAYRLGNFIYKYLKNTSKEHQEWIKYLIKVSPHYQHTLFPIDYFKDEENNFCGIILKNIHNPSSINSLSPIQFYKNLQQINQEFQKYKQDGILPIDTGYHNSKVQNHQIYIFDTDEFQPNSNYDVSICFNHYGYDLLKNILFQKCQSQNEIKLLNQYFEQIKSTISCLKYIEETVLSYQTLEEFASITKETITQSQNKKTNRR